MADEEKSTKAEKTPKPIAGVSFSDYVDMSAAEREDFHKRHFRSSARFERELLKEEHGGHRVATAVVVLALAGGAFLLWRAAKAKGQPIYQGSPLDFFRQGPALAGVVGGGVGAAAGLLTGSSPAKFAMIGAGLGVVGSALNPAHKRSMHHHHDHAAQSKQQATPSAAATQPAPSAATTRGMLVGAPNATDIFHAQMRLGQLGYQIPVDGKMSPALTSALKDFQATYSLLTTDGSLSQETLANLDQIVHQMLTGANPVTGLHEQLPSWA